MPLHSLAYSNMKNKLLPLFNKLLLHKRSIIQTIKRLLKKISRQWSIFAIAAPLTSLLI
ncbi:transposase [Nitrosomonas communis]|uniref:transposase n=1 Tax=Nitrosomonas TaxID=914 RepID=UPI0011875411